MVITLRQGTRTFVLRTGRAGTAALDPAAARDVLRRAVREDAAPLRRALVAVGGDPAVHALDRETLVRRLSDWVALGALTLHEVRPPAVEIVPRGPTIEPPPAHATFASATATVEPAREPDPAPTPQRSWISIALVRDDDVPIANQRYRIELPDGSVREGTLDAEGQLHLRDIDPGQCRVTFPDL